MSSLSNIIEQYLNKLIQQSGQKKVEIQRNELAEKFDCAPSQINYVLATRFTIERGYVVESRRGGGGFVRIVKVPLNTGEMDLLSEVISLVGDRISERRATAILARLLEEELVTPREVAIIKACLGRNVLRIGLPARDQLRANILKSILMVIFKHSK
ncbi:CtsR family transcriptional regulator [Desulfallas thermosapovorans]|uniref:Transcriptional regulator CtsR n=1 Tax=Desulfallas thermosapovorans DSM 6562 TaxID=1121431 RepID=A0A5S4ZPC6_9FIRM|nr:CtsR family transcriptional regulator [Desulfallas thermosapovorans]TYO94641.1 transcriptional regulator CtsR [Desulfallas thermosapovorans DSM 6562]